MEKFCTEGHVTDKNMAQTHCKLDNLGYKHTLRICSIYCFSTAMMVAEKGLSVTFHVGVNYQYCLSCFTDTHEHVHNPTAATLTIPHKILPVHC
jgi:Pyruvate/2-oxoacid:ferredoxin oxidoreductase delta subunit